MLELFTSHRTIKVFARLNDDGLFLSKDKVADAREWLGDGHISVYGESKKYGNVDSCIFPGEEYWVY